MSDIDILLQEINTNMITVTLLKISDVIVINNNICAITEILNSKSKFIKYYIYGYDIFNKKHHEVTHNATDIVVKITPAKFNLPIIKINNNNTCNLQYFNNVIYDFCFLPIDFKSDKIDFVNQGLNVIVCVDRSIDTLFHIKSFKCE